MAKVISSLPGSTGTLSRTSQLTNDGESGVSTYVELDDISTVATTGDYNNLINVPIDFTPRVHTHNISDISGTKSEFNTSLTDGDFLFVGDVLDTPDATTTSKGVIKLAGDLAGTADAPTVPGLANKVDKVAGKSLIADAEITRLTTLSNYTHPTNHSPSVITQDASNRFVTDAEKTAWNAKQSAIGYTTENIANKNVANGYAGLGSDGKLISSQLPYITISDTYVVASQALMLGLTLAEKGDVAVRTDLNKSFILKGNSYSTLADWQELLTPTSAVTTVFGRNGTVTAQTGDYNTSQVAESIDKYYQTYNQKLYNDATSSIQTQLNAKQASGSYEIAFSKNTAFNKPFGITAGTVAEGNDSRINNGQTAFGWGNHAGLYPSLTGAGANGTWGINISGNSQTSSALGEYNWNPTVKDNADFMFGRNAANEIAIISQLGVRNFLGLGSNAYNSTAYLPLSGGTVNGSVYFNSTTGGLLSFQTNSLPLALMTSSQNIIIGGSTTDFNTYVYGNNPYNIWTNGVKRVTVDGSGNVDFTGAISGTSATFSSSVEATQYNIYALNTAPTSATATGTTGEIRITSGFIYICIATNTWVRAALTTWI